MTTAPAATRLMTADELLMLPDDGNSYELIDGELFTMSPSATIPGIVAANLLGDLALVVRQGNLGICGTADSGFKLRTAPDTVRAPDVWFVKAERVPQGDARKGFWALAPDLAVEILSPSDRYSYVIRKAQDYLAAGSQLVWVIDPEGRSAAVFTPDGIARLLGEDDVLDGRNVVPGFAVTVRDLLP